MPLAEEAAQCLFSPDPHWTIGLAVGAQELQVGGYSRQPSSWSIDGATATTRVAFGPFSAGVAIDSVLILNGDERIEVIQLRDGPIRLLAGMRLLHEIIVSFGDDDAL